MEKKLKYLTSLFFCLVFFIPDLFAIDPFAIRCENNEKVNDDLKELYFFNKTKRFTGYYAIKSNAILNISGIKVPYNSELNKCRYDGEETNRLFYNCESEYSGGYQLPETGVGIDRAELVLLRSYTTVGEISNYKQSGMQIFFCAKLTKEESEQKLNSFKQEKKDLNKKIKEAKESLKGKNKI